MNEIDGGPALTDAVLLEHAVDRFGARCEAEWLKSRGLKNYTSQFLEHGYFVAPIPDELAEKLKGYFVPGNESPISPHDVRSDYHNARLDEGVAKKLNELNTYYGEPSADVVDALESYFDAIKDRVTDYSPHDALRTFAPQSEAS